MKRKKYVKIYLFITMIEKGGRVNESKIGTEDFKSNHTRKKNNSNLQSSLLQVSAVLCFLFFPFINFLHNFPQHKN
jgi:hypothetical protein